MFVVVKSLGPGVRQTWVGTLALTLATLVILSKLLYVSLPVFPLVAIIVPPYFIVLLET